MSSTAVLGLLVLLGTVQLVVVAAVAPATLRLLRQPSPETDLPR
ncbi:hypothetical protein BH23ACT9_BH23ACT9_29780 [soil metagenome]